MTLDDPLKPNAILLVKLGSIAVQRMYVELVGFRRDQLLRMQTLLSAEDVRTWLEQMTKMAFLPVKR